ncbi:MAG: glycosyltransferase [Limnothrix sp. RL_2_0]|nr:glycosyltransferase [Limnothrix sp. RL_2_0]
MQPFIQDYSTTKQFTYSIILPLSNDLCYFVKWLESLLSQSHQGSTEILFIDNSFDHSIRPHLEKIIQRYFLHLEKKDYTFYYIHHPQKLKYYDSLNTTLQLVNGEWIYISGQNISLEEKTFSRFDQAIQTCTNLDLICGRFYQINTEAEIVKTSPLLGLEGLVNQDFFSFFLFNNPLESAPILYNKKIFELLGYFNSQLEQFIDWEFLRRITQSSCTTWYYYPKYLACSCSDSAEKDVLNPPNYSSQSIWKMINLGQQYYPHREQKLVKKSQYIKLFTFINQLFLDAKVDQTFSLLWEIVQYSELGDRLWLEVLNQSKLKYKREIYDVIVMFSRTLSPC